MPKLLTSAQPFNVGFSIQKMSLSENKHLCMQPMNSILKDMLIINLIYGLWDAYFLKWLLAIEHGVMKKTNLLKDLSVKKKKSLM
jgi:hypothetical protein